MSLRSVKFLLSFIFILTFCFNANAQADASTPSGRIDPSKESLPLGIQETLAKGRIKQAEKEYQQLVERGEEAAELVEELSQALESGQKLSTEDKKKLDRLEKLIKRIRRDLGGEDDDQIKNEKSDPVNLSGVIKNIKEDTANLLSEIKKIGRYTISVIAIKSSNSVLSLIRFLRFNSN